MAQRGDRGADATVAGAGLDRQRALSGCWDEVVGGPPAKAPEAPQPGRGEHDRVEVTGLEAPEPGVEVAVQVSHLEIAAQRKQLRAPAQTAGSDARPGGQRRDRRRTA